MNPLRVAVRWWEEVDNEYIDARLQEFERFPDELPQGDDAALISGGDDFDDADPPPQPVAEGDPVAPGGERLFLGLHDVARFRGDSRQCTAGRFLRVKAPPSS